MVDNRGGAGGTVGTRAVAKSAPDGYTILLGYTGTLAIGPHAPGSRRLRPAQGFRADRLIGARAEWSLVVHPSIQAKSVPS